MPERRICSFSHEEIEPGTGMMFVRRDGSVKRAELNNFILIKIIVL